MAGTVVHLVIADMLAQDLKNTEILVLGHGVKLDIDYFIAGNICPDGVMARRNYVRDMKKHTHFRDGIRDCDFYKAENLALFKQRLDRFIKENMKVMETADMRSLYLGYLTHMITDEMFMIQIRPRFLENISSIGLTEQNMETFRHFSKDVDMIDFRLVNEYKGVGRIYNTLSNIKPYEIYGMITEEELTNSRKWILKYFFETEHRDIAAPVYISYEAMQEFIDRAVEAIEKKIVENNP